MADVPSEAWVAELLAGFSLGADDERAVCQEAVREASMAPLAPITAHELDLLIEGSGLHPAVEADIQADADGDPESAFRRATAEDTALELARLVTTSVRGREAADMLGCSEGALSFAADDGRLFSFEFNDLVRYPLWQFHFGEPLPGLADVLAALPQAWRSRKIEAVMTTPAEVLTGRSPVDWLAHGQDPYEVIDLIRGLARV